MTSQRCSALAWTVVVILSTFGVNAQDPVATIRMDAAAEMLLDGKRVSRIEAKALPAFFATGGFDRDAKTVVVRATSYGPRRSAPRCSSPESRRSAK